VVFLAYYAEIRLPESGGSSKSVNTFESSIYSSAMALTKRIIPCLDLKSGRVVKGTNFLGLRDAGDPVELACRYNDQGADEVVFLDITASKEGRSALIHVIERAADELFLPLTVGGGISTTGDMTALLRAGADKVSVNTSAVKNPGLINEGAEMFGNQCIVAAIDARRNDEMKDGVNEIVMPDGSVCWYEVVIYGGSKTTGIDAVSWAKEAEERGAGEILLTSMETDGVKQGFDIPVTAKIASEVGIPVIASGGVGNIQHFYDGFVKGHADACLAASVFHFGEMTVRDVKEYLLRRDVPVRMDW
jgi:cyclase